MQLIFDNIIFALQKAGGISVVWHNLLNELRRMGISYNTIEYYGFENNLFRRGFDMDTSLMEIREFRVSKKFEQLLNVNINNIKRPFIFHSSYFRVCSNPAAINITTVHDFIYENGFSEIGIPERVRIWKNHKTIRDSDWIVCISENTRQDLLKYIKGIDENRVSVIYNGVSEDYHMLDVKNVGFSDCILFVGARYDYKNFNFAVKVAKHAHMRLLICGNDLSTSERTLLDRQLGEKGYVFKLRPSNKELNSLYNSVKCLLYPSSYEGFGIPVLEAQRAGCPVIALKSSSIPEVMGEGGCLLSKLDVREAIEHIKSLDNIEVKNNLVIRGLQNSKRFTWNLMASQYLDLYRHLMVERSKNCGLQAH